MTKSMTKEQIDQARQVDMECIHHQIVDIAELIARPITRQDKDAGMRIENYFRELLEKFATVVWNLGYLQGQLTPDVPLELNL